MTPLAIATALGAEVDLSADVKTFTVGVVLPEPAEPFSSSVLDLRGKLDVSHGPLDGELHATAGAGDAALPLGVGLGEDELVDLSWSNEHVRARIDRASVRYRRDHLDVRVGRQPVSVGTGTIFRPMDVIAPFSVATVDSEYKPGIDGIRVDAYAGVSSTATVVVAYDQRALVYGQTTLRNWDVGVFGGALNGWQLAGLATAGGIGPVGVRGEATIDADAEIRASLGFDMAFSRGFLAAEGYVQTAPADNYWLTGRSYAAVTGSFEIVPLWNASVAVIANVEEPSALLAPAVSWSVAENADLTASGFVGLGKRPDDFFVPQSEFGSLPAAGVFSMRAYF